MVPVKPGTSHANGRRISGEAECMDCAYRIVRVIAVEEVRGDTLLDLLHRGVCVGDAGGGAWRST